MVDGVGGGSTGPIGPIDPEEQSRSSSRGSEGEIEAPAADQASTEAAAEGTLSMTRAGATAKAKELQKETGAPPEIDVPEGFNLEEFCSYIFSNKNIKSQTLDPAAKAAILATQQNLGEGFHSKIKQAKTVSSEITVFESDGEKFYSNTAKIEITLENGKTVHLKHTLYTNKQAQEHNQQWVKMVSSAFRSNLCAALEISATIGFQKPTDQKVLEAAKKLLNETVVHAKIDNNEISLYEKIDAEPISLIIQQAGNKVSNETFKSFIYTAIKADTVARRTLNLTAVEPPSSSISTEKEPKAGGLATRASILTGSSTEDRQKQAAIKIQKAAKNYLRRIRSTKEPSPITQAEKKESSGILTAIQIGASIVATSRTESYSTMEEDGAKALLESLATGTDQDKLLQIISSDKENKQLQQFLYRLGSNHLQLQALKARVSTPFSISPKISILLTAILQATNKPKAKQKSEKLLQATAPIATGDELSTSPLPEKIKSLALSRLNPPPSLIKALTIFQNTDVTSIVATLKIGAESLDESFKNRLLPLLDDLENNPDFSLQQFFPALAKDLNFDDEFAIVNTLSFLSSVFQKGVEKQLEAAKPPSKLSSDSASVEKAFNASLSELTPSLKPPSQEQISSFTQALIEGDKAVEASDYTALVETFVQELKTSSHPALLFVHFFLKASELSGSKETALEILTQPYKNELLHLQQEALKKKEISVITGSDYSATTSEEATTTSKVDQLQLVLYVPKEESTSLETTKIFSLFPPQPLSQPGTMTVWGEKASTIDQVAQRTTFSEFFIPKGLLVMQPDKSSLSSITQTQAHQIGNFLAKGAYILPKPFSKGLETLIKSPMFTKNPIRGLQIIQRATLESCDNNQEQARKILHEVFHAGYIKETEPAPSKALTDTKEEITDTKNSDSATEVGSKATKESDLFSDGYGISELFKLADSEDRATDSLQAFDSSIEEARPLEGRVIHLQPQQVKESIKDVAADALSDKSSSSESLKAAPPKKVLSDDFLTTFSDEEQKIIKEYFQKLSADLEALLSSNPKYTQENILDILTTIPTTEEERTTQIKEREDLFRATESALEGEDVKVATDLKFPQSKLLLGLRDSIISETSEGITIKGSLIKQIKSIVLKKTPTATSIPNEVKNVAGAVNDTATGSMIKRDAKTKSTKRESAATTIQAAIRGHFARKKVSHIRAENAKTDAAIKIQALFRGYLAKKEKLSLQEKRESAATTIQAAIRGHFARKKVSHIRAENAKTDAAIKIQALFRGYLAKKEKLSLQEKREGAATTIQAAMRGHLARKKVSHIRAENAKTDAAIKIQALFRGYLAKKEKLSLQEKRESAATTIQAAIRGHFARKKVSHIRAENAKTDAAIKIQALFRGYLAKKEKLSLQEKREGAATTIQAAMRGHLARKKVSHIRAENAKTDAAIKIQALFRGYLAKKEKLSLQEKRESAATTIQTAIRGHFARKKVSHIRAENAKTDAAIKIQALFRGYLAKKEKLSLQEKRESAATTIQTAIRGHLARKKVSHIKAEAATTDGRTTIPIKTATEFESFKALQNEYHSFPRGTKTKEAVKVRENYGRFSAIIRELGFDIFSKDQDDIQAIENVFKILNNITETDENIINHLAMFRKRVINNLKRAASESDLKKISEYVSSSKEIKTLAEATEQLQSFQNFLKTLNLGSNILEINLASNPFLQEMIKDGKLGDSLQESIITKARLTRSESDSINAYKLVTNNFLKRELKSASSKFLSYDSFGKLTTAIKKAERGKLLHLSRFSLSFKNTINKINPSRKFQGKIFNILNNQDQTEENIQNHVLLFAYKVLDLGVGVSISEFKSSSSDYENFLKQATDLISSLQEEVSFEKTQALLKLMKNNAPDLPFNMVIREDPFLKEICDTDGNLTLKKDMAVVRQSLMDLKTTFFAQDFKDGDAEVEQFHDQEYDDEYFSGFAEVFATNIGFKDDEETISNIETILKNADNSDKNIQNHLLLITHNIIYDIIDPDSKEIKESDQNFLIKAEELISSLNLEEVDPEKTKELFDLLKEQLSEDDLEAFKLNDTVFNSICEKFSPSE